MAIDVDTITLPDFWACALVNGDTSGMTAAEVSAMNTYLAAALDGGWHVVATTDDEPRFTSRYRLYGGDADAGTVCDYVILKP